MGWARRWILGIPLRRRRLLRLRFLDPLRLDLGGWPAGVLPVRRTRAPTTLTLLHHLYRLRQWYPNNDGLGGCARRRLGLRSRFLDICLPWSVRVDLLLGGHPVLLRRWVRQSPFLGPIGVSQVQVVVDVPAPAVAFVAPVAIAIAVIVPEVHSFLTLPPLGLRDAKGLVHGLLDIVLNLPREGLRLLRQGLDVELAEAELAAPVHGCAPPAPARLASAWRGDRVCPIGLSNRLGAPEAEAGALELQAQEREREREREREEKMNYIKPNRKRREVTLAETRGSQASGQRS